MDKLLVVGASGLLGSKAMELGGMKWEVHGTYSRNQREGISQLDVTNRAKVFELIEKIRPDVVFDSHGLNNVEYGELHKDELWAVDFEGSRNVAEASKKVGAKYIFISSDYVFSGRKSVYTEKDRTDPINYLGMAKAATEYIIEVFGIDAIVARTSGLYGAMSSTGKKSFMPWVVESLQKGTQIDVISDQWNTPTLVDDLVNLVFALAESDKRGIFNIVGKDCISKYEFAMRIAKEFDLDRSLIKPCKTSDISQVAVKPERVKLSTRKIRRLFPEVPRGVNKGLKFIHKSLII